MNANVRPVFGIEFSRGRSVRSSASDLLRWAGLASLACAQTDAASFTMRRAPAGTVLVVEGQPLLQLYCVAAGSFKTTQTDREGYEQVLGFGLRGDLLGLDALCHQRHASSAVALEDSSVAVLPMQEFLTLGRQIPALECLLLHAAGAELQHRSDTQYLMCAPSSEVRVARFLMHIAQRQAAMGLSGRQLRLRMTRRDIAGCLGLAHETVSRALTALAQHGCIGVSHRDIEIVDAQALRELQRVTRGSSRGRLPSRPAAVEERLQA